MLEVRIPINENFEFDGFASRGHHELNLEAMKMIEDWFSCDIYAETTNKLSSMCLHRLGYKKIDTNLYVKEKK